MKAITKIGIFSLLLSLHLGFVGQQHQVLGEELSCAAATEQIRALELDGSCGAIATKGQALRMNDIQAVGSHNSYKLAIPEAEMSLLRSYNEATAVSLDYSHLSLTDQLNLGMRQIELDILYDPEGGRYTDPLLAQQTQGMAGAEPFNSMHMSSPGFKVLHVQDLDPRSNCATWILCLNEIKRWSLANPQHIPILIMFNAKTGGSAYPGVQEALDFTATAFAELDAEVLSVFDAEHLIKPDDVRQGYSTLREAVLNEGWPLLDSVRGKVFFALDEGPEKVEIYQRGNSALEGLPLFVNSVSADADHAAYFTMNNPVSDQARIQQAVRSGFMVRTRADAGTMEARLNQTERRTAAFSSGAHYVSTDYYVAREEFSDYAVQLPGGNTARFNPLREPNR